MKKPIKLCIWDFLKSSPKLKRFAEDSLIKAHQHTEAVRESVDTLATMLHNWLDEMQEKINVVKTEPKKPSSVLATKDSIHDFANTIRDNNSFMQQRGDA